MKKFRISGSVFGTDGYSNKTRQFIYGLIDNEFDDFVIYQHGVNDSYFKYVDDRYSDVIKRHTTDIIEDVDISLSFSIPVLARRIKCNKLFNFTAWETYGYPDVFAKHINENVDEVFVPSVVNANVISEHVNRPVHVMYDTVDVDFDIKERLSSDRLRLYSIFEWSERKNPMAMLRSYDRAFTASDNVSLTIKTRPFGSDRDIYGLNEYMLSRKSDAPELVIITNDISEADIKKIHNDNDVFVYTTRGEGFGLPAFEAMLHGNHIISNKTSAVYELLSSYNYFKYEIYDFVSARREFCRGHVPVLYNHNQMWDTINEEDLVKTLRKTYNNFTANAGYMKLHERRVEFSQLMSGKINRKKITEEFVKDYI